MIENKNSQSERNTNDLELARQMKMALWAVDGFDIVTLTGRNIDEWRESALHLANLINAAYILLDGEVEPYSDLSELDQQVWDLHNEIMFVRMLRSLDPSVRRDQGYFLTETRSAADLFAKLCDDGRYIVGMMS